MNKAKRYMLAAAATAAVAASLIGTGVAMADTGGIGGGQPTDQSPQSSTQVLDFTGATGQTGLGCVQDANNGAAGTARPDGADGVECQYPPADPRYVEGPVGGLIKNGPQG